LALSLKNSNEEQQIAETIEEYKLALIFLPKDQLESKQTICHKLAELTNEDQRSIELWLAIAENNIIEVQKIANDGVDLNHASFMNITPLIQTIKIGNIAMISVLLSGNIDINKPNTEQDQASPLYCSLGYLGQPVNMAIVKLLLDNGAKVDQPMYDGNTPMHMAHYKGNKEAIELLYQYQANINAQNAESKTPLHCLLEKKGINSETKLEITQAFHQIYDITIRDQNCKTVIDYAKEHCPELLSLLGNELLTTSAISTSVNMDDISVTLLADIDLSKTNQDSPSPE
jgi:ankyrin repeat protein